MLLSFLHSEMTWWQSSTDKWVKYYLTNEELTILNKLNADERISNASELFEVNVGLVSGENDFFLMSWKEIKERGIDEITPIISRSEQVKGVFLSQAEYLELKEKGKKVSIFTPGDKPFEELSKNAQDYILWGESKEFMKAENRKYIEGFQQAGENIVFLGNKRMNRPLVKLYKISREFSTH